MGQSPNATTEAIAAAAEALLSGPGLQPPPGVIPNFIDPPSQAYWVYITLPVCLAVSTPFVWIRLCTAVFILKSHGWADYANATAWAFLVGYCTSIYFTVEYGGGLANTTEMIYSPGLFLAKFSILLMYRRLFDTAGTGKTHYLIHILIWANLAFYFPYLAATVFQCVPRARIWDPMLKGGCINLKAAFIAASAINVVSDFSILLLPLYRLSKLKIPTRRKIGVLAIFAVGLFTCIASIMRLVVSFHTGSPDKTFYLQPPALWSTGELASAILCGCMPATAAFFNHLSPMLAKKWSLYLRPSNSPSKIEKGGTAPPLPRSSWKAPRAWNESELLRSESHVGSDLEDGAVPIRQVVSHCSDEVAREKVEEHLLWSGWRR
ncbi:MAG: hypothetical protein ASARMPREDX12_007986 [Alectoria sarmentosa]|nr:MAG: hypothetical protein ASARMPREDX12_007986 [Alectoria sarmentosa]